jgi:hypothetical protein
VNCGEYIFALLFALQEGKHRAGSKARQQGTGHESLWGTVCFLIMSGKSGGSFTRGTRQFVAATLGPLSGRSGHYPPSKTG